jgi:hypothetical protein
MSNQPWAEVYLGGSFEAEQAIFATHVQSVMRLQLWQAAGGKPLARASHPKLLVGVTNARLHVSSDLPEAYCVDHFQPGRVYRVTIRFSNAHGIRPDSARDLRGAALRIHVGGEQSQDLLLTNYPVTHVRDARQFMVVMKALAGSRSLFVPRLILSLGPLQAVRTAACLWHATRRRVRSLALESYWSKGAILWGGTPVRYIMRPAVGPGSSIRPQLTDSYLHDEMAVRLKGADVGFDLYVQPFMNEKDTPIEDFSVAWNERVSRPVRVGRITIPRQDLDTDEGRAMAQQVDALSFNPWFTTEQFRPLGNLNRARKEAYRASAAHRLGHRFYEEPPLRNVVLNQAAIAVFELLNRRWPWYRMPSWRIALLNLSVLRSVLRRHNLLDTRLREARVAPCSAPQPIPDRVRGARTHDGTYNDLSEPDMGRSGAPSGRNMSPIYQPEHFDRPDPVVISRELLTREEFIPATSLNVLAAAWIQFQVHDWVNHERFELGEPGKDVVLELRDGRLWRNHRDLPPEGQMRISGNKVLHTARAGYPVFANAATAWWDGSELYGADERKAAELRAGPLIRLENGYLPKDVSGLSATGFNDSWWLGLSAMHTLFAREHNVVCGELQKAYPTWSDERVFQTARLVVSAVIAKIHTVEWTPAILARKPIEVGLPANWYGAPQDWLTRLGVWLLDAHALKGIPQTRPDHFGVPYSLTEEFASVYRLHPLIPDEYAFVSCQDGRTIETCGFDQIQGRVTDTRMRELGLSNVLYSLGIAHPGAITLHNFPRALQRLERINGEMIDLSVVDIVRDRRRGIPRYNDFRAGLHVARLRDWHELSSNASTREKLRDIYGRLDMVDTMIGLLAETPPAGFGFSDTAFRVFILMATRRLQSDRFLTVDFRPEVYSPLGIDWVAKTDMRSIILRHAPELAPALSRAGSPFAPWHLMPPQSSRSQVALV